MRRLALVLVVAGLLGLAQVGQAATLSSTWYVNLWAPAIFTYGEQGAALSGDGYFYSTPAGQYGPFQVADPYGDRVELKITLPHTVYGAGPEQSLVIPFSTGLGAGTRIAYLSLAGVTSYDPNGMYLGLYRTRDDGTTETLWTQKQDGTTGLAGHVAYDIVSDGQFFFRVNVVPEPSTTLALLFGCAALAAFVKRKA